MIGFIIDNIVTKGKSAIDEFKNNLHNSVCYACILE